MSNRHAIAKRVFQAAALYGILVLLPQFFLEERLGIDFPPPLNHPEHFYGFIGVALAWQFVFLVIASDVLRYRPLMLVAVLEKLAFGIPAWALYAQGRVHTAVVVAGSVDLLIGVLFVAAWSASRAPAAGTVAAHPH